MLADQLGELGIELGELAGQEADAGGDRLQGQSGDAVLDGGVSRARSWPRCGPAAG